MKGLGPSLGNEDAQKFGVNDRLWESRKKEGALGTGQAGAGRTTLTATGSALAGKLGKASNYGSGVLRDGSGQQYRKDVPGRGAPTGLKSSHSTRTGVLALVGRKTV